MVNVGSAPHGTQAAELGDSEAKSRLAARPHRRIIAQLGRVPPPSTRISRLK
jgi:hypothetical protein